LNPRRPLAEYFLLAIASIFWPLLFAIVVVALRTAHPIPVLTGFLAGGLLTTITVGVVIVFTLENRSFVTGSRPPADPIFSIAAGALALLAAFVLRGMAARPRKPKEPKPDAGPGRTERMVESVRLAFVAGIVLNIAPGIFPFVALKDIAQLSAPAGAKVLLVVVFYVIMFASVEIPIVGAWFAPARTTAAMQSLNDWLDVNGRRLAVWVLALVGVYLVVRGVVAI
jgi:hypothetical protein